MRSLVSTLGALLLAASSGPAGPLWLRSPVGEELLERHVALMGTLCELRVEAADRSAALQASEAAVRALEAVEARLSTWRDDSELARLNRTPPGTPFPLGTALRAELDRVRHWWRATEGAFDPGVGRLVELWGLRTGGRRPDPDELRAALAVGGLAALELGPEGALRRRPGLVLEEGGFGKGAGLDAALEALRAAGADSAVIDLGGQVALFGGGAPEPFELADPRDRARGVLELRVASGSFATSGNAERGIEVDGQALGHLLDPRTGLPAADFGSLTVWAERALDADCLSTGLYVLGPDSALGWAEGREGIEVLVIEVTPDGLRARATPGWRGHLRALVPDLQLELGPPPTEHR